HLSPTSRGCDRRPVRSRVCLLRLDLDEPASALPFQPVRPRRRHHRVLMNAGAALVRPSGRIEAAFARMKAENRTGFVAFLTVGYPDIDSTLRFVPALVEGGADIIELGIPFSDPLAEGPTIQHSSFRALQQGVTPRICLDVAGKLRETGVEAPLV